MLLARVATAALLLAVFLAANFLLARPHFAVLMTLVIAAAAYEWAKLCRLAGAAALAYSALVGGLLVTLMLALLPGDGARGAANAVMIAAGLFWMVVAPVWLWRGVAAQPRALLAAAGIAVLVPAGLAAVALPPADLLALLGLVWLADSAAYFAGRAFGRRKLAPTISPGKTWAGVWGAVLATSAYAIICAVSIPTLASRIEGRGWVAYVSGAVLLCLVSIVGDLFESALKRQAGVKDSGRLLPGHGGILDRIDSATATLPVGALLLHWILI
ncbi:MAG TPA: phosphatidate cytidylyltransferase [Burkholderiales bacterium]|nr:phosphatidate cytidylyltransferase [Burkholderiales bacterium]